MALDVKGKTVVITGTLPGIQRRDAEAKLKKKGANVTGSVSKNTHILFAAEDAGSKLGDANRLGVAVHSVADLFAIIGKPAAPKAAVKKPAAGQERERANKIAAKTAAKTATKKPAKASVKTPASKKSEAASGNSLFAGKVVVVTGTLSKGRSEIEGILRKAGAKVTSSVSKNTQFLIAGVAAGSKLSDAEEFDIPVLSEAAMNDMLSGKQPRASSSDDESGEDESGEDDDSSDE